MNDLFQKQFPRLLPVMLLAGVSAWAQEVALTPQKVVEFAARNNQAVLDARYAVEAELLSVEGMAARFKPLLKIHGSFAHLNEAPSVSLPDNLPFPTDIDIVTSPQDLWAIGYTVTQPIFAGTRLLSAYRTAKYRYQSAGQNALRIEQEVRLAALRLYWAYVSAWQNLRPQQETIAWLEQLARDVGAMVEAGVVVEDEKLRMKTQLALAKLGIVRSRDALADIGAQLLLLCNLPSTTAIMVDTIVISGLEKDSTQIEISVDSVMRTRADIQAVELQISALEAARRGQVSAYLPSVGAAFTQEFKNRDPSDPNRLENYWSVGASLEWNLLDWGAGRSERARTAVAISQARLALDTRKRAIRTEIESARRKVAESLEAQALALESVDNSQRALRNADARYRAGLITSTDLLNMRKELTQTQQELISARIRKVIAVEELRAAAGLSPLPAAPVKKYTVSADTDSN